MRLARAADKPARQGTPGSLSARARRHLSRDRPQARAQRQLPRRGRRGPGRHAEPQGSGKRASEPPGLQLPPPRQAMADQDIARARRERIVPRFSCVTIMPKLHHRLAPHGDLAGSDLRRSRAGRVEALGAQRMLGVAANLASAHAARHRRAPRHPRRRTGRSRGCVGAVRPGEPARVPLTERATGAAR